MDRSGRLATACVIGASVIGMSIVGLATEAAAQVRYRTAPDPYYPEAIYPFGVPDADARSGTYSYEILPATPVGPVVRVQRRCTYPNGWNVTDFSRDVNGIPPGADHVCPGR